MVQFIGYGTEASTPGVSHPQWGVSHSLATVFLVKGNPRTRHAHWSAEAQAIAFKRSFNRSIDFGVL